MFDEEFSLDDLRKGVRIPISAQVDDGGYYDRVCPNEVCRHEFKVLFDDWRDKVPEEAARCPLCGKQAEQSEFNTAEFDAYIEDVAMSVTKQAIDELLENWAEDFNLEHSQDGFVKMSMDYHPGTEEVPVPAAAAEMMRQRFTCEECGCRYASIGAAYFCPACGHNSAKSTFDQTLEIVRQSVAALETAEASVLDALGKDVAKDFVRGTLEGQIGRVVGAFQRLAESLFDELPNSSSFKPRPNVFQNLEASSDLWERAGKPRYEAILGSKDYQRLSTFVQRRHKITHLEGFVDQAYVDKSGDPSYKPGERLVVCKDDVLDIVDLVARLAEDLRK